MKELRLICYILGYILVFGGLFSIEWKQSDERRVVAEAINDTMSMPYGSNVAFRAAREVWDNTAPWFIKPALVMVSGAVLIDIGARRKQPPKAEPNIK
jgi:hypothetical protein